MQINLLGKIIVECDKCLDPCEISINNTQNLIFKSSTDIETTQETKGDETVIEIPENTEYIQMDKYLYDFAMLSIPIRRVHPEDENGKSECNQEMLKILEKYKAKNQKNFQWEELKKIKFSN
jgi:uncharacterized metal-binding protein YceD (DUF177 family)